MTPSERIGDTKKKIAFIFGYDADDTDSAKVTAGFNRPPEYIIIQDITKKHTVGKSYHAIEKELLALLSSEVEKARVEELENVYAVQDISETEAYAMYYREGNNDFTVADRLAELNHNEGVKE